MIGKLFNKEVVNAALVFALLGAVMVLVTKDAGARAFLSSPH